MFKFIIKWWKKRKAPSKELYEFYKAWLKWAEGGGKEIDYFGVWYGLCCSATLYSEPGLDLTDQLKRDFRSQGLSVAYPFGESTYRMYAVSGRMHTDPNRLAWVRERIAVYEKVHENS